MDFDSPFSDDYTSLYWRVSFVGGLEHVVPAFSEFVVRNKTKHGQTLKTRRFAKPEELVGEELGFIPPQLVPLGGPPVTYAEIDAYFMGLCAGDGSFSKTEIRFQFHGDERSFLLPELTRYLSRVHRQDYMSGCAERRGNKDLQAFGVTERYLPSGLPQTLLRSVWYATRLKNLYGFCKETKFIIPKLSTSRQRAFYLSGLFGADGCVDRPKRGRGKVDLYQSNKPMLGTVQKLLYSLGVVSHLTLHKSSREVTFKFKDRPDIVSTSKDAYVLTVSSFNVQRFYEAVGFWLYKPKVERLESLITRPGRTQNHHFKTVERVELVRLPAY